jgi:dTDP-4-dehydrorhamnose reductase
MKILVYGSNGWIGKMFIDILIKNDINYIEGMARADNIIQVSSEIELYQPTHIISFIGRTHGEGYSTIDYLEQKDKLVENVRDNLYGPYVLAHLASQYNIHYTYLGTGCIFKYDDMHLFGSEENGFTEEDLPNFFGSSYSVVKGFTDMMMHTMPHVLNLRIRMPITNVDNPRNFITKITTYKKVCSVPNSMTVLTELLPYVVDMMKNKTTGTINLTNTGLISHNEILEMYRELVDNNFKWENHTIEEQSLILKADRSNNYLDTSKLTQMYPNIMNIKDAVRECLKNYLFNKN